MRSVDLLLVILGLMCPQIVGRRRYLEHDIPRPWRPLVFGLLRVDPAERSDATEAAKDALELSTLAGDLMVLLSFP